MKTQKCVQIDGKPVIVDSHIAAEISRLADQNAELLGALEQCKSLMISAHHHLGSDPDVCGRTLHKAEDIARLAIHKAQS